MNRKILLITVLIMGLILAGCKSDGGQEQAKIIGEVNGDKISQTEFDQHLKILKLFYEQQMWGGSQKLDESKDKETIEKLEEQTFKEMVMQKILWQQAKEQDIKISDSEIDKIMKQQDYKTFLEESGLDEKYFRQEMKTQILYWKLHDKITAKTTAVSYTHLRAHETVLDLVCRLLLEKKHNHNYQNQYPTTNTTTNIFLHTPI